MQIPNPNRTDHVPLFGSYECPGPEVIHYSACFDGHTRGVSLLVSKSLDVAGAFVFADLVGSLCVLDVTIKDNSLNLIASPPMHWWK